MFSLRYFFLTLCLVMIEINSLSSPRMVAYINCLCGFGVASDGDNSCLPDAAGKNVILEWEQQKSSPVTHYIISFLSFSGSKIQTDPGSVWEDTKGSTTNFKLNGNLSAALTAASKNGKKIILSIGGEIGSRGFPSYWKSKGSDTASRVKNMRADISAVMGAFQTQNGIQVDGIDVDIELGQGYKPASDKYNSTRDLINAIPDTVTAAFVPQVGNGLCAPPVEADDPFTPEKSMGGQCMEPPLTGDTFSLTFLDRDCVKSDGSKKLDYVGIQYYNAGEAVCCGGTGPSIIQNYKNLANGWPEVTAADLANASNPWHKWQYWPGPWMAFAGFTPERLVLGKPSCHGCAGSDYLDMDTLFSVFNGLKGKLKGKMGGILYWDLCRIFGQSGKFCVGGQCQPSWGGTNEDAKKNLQNIVTAMSQI